MSDYREITVVTEEGTREGDSVIYDQRDVLSKVEYEDGTEVYLNVFTDYHK